MATATVAIHPGRGLGSINLGASLHEVFTLIHNDKATYSKINFNYDPKSPLTLPSIIVLPQNGLRLRFDGPDQRLRLIEVLDFTKIRLTFKGQEFYKQDKTGGPLFQKIYRLFGASYPGEYHAPKNGDAQGSYVLSWTGVAFSFPLKHYAYSPQKDHVSLLNSNAAAPATLMCLFEGSSWPEARHDIFVRRPEGPRLSAIADRPKDNIPAEIEYASISTTTGRVELLRRPPAGSFTIVLNETTEQDLITELGPPDSTHKREINASPTEQPSHARAGSMSNGLRPHSYDGRGSQPSSYSSTGTDTFDADFDSGDAEEDPTERSSREIFWNYYSHGIDILLGPPDQDAPSAPLQGQGVTPLAASQHLVVNKVILHGNVPGSYAFNRHRRLRWVLDFPDTEYLETPLNSEMPFSELRPALLHLFHGSDQHDMGKGKVINRTWGGGAGGGAAGMSESGFFLPDAETELVEGSGSENWLGNTRVFSFEAPGMGALGFEVMENGSVVGATLS